jgi:hypothetical protein
MRWLFVALISGTVGTAVYAQGADVGVVNLVSGNVSYASPSGNPAEAKPYMRVRDGDRFVLAAGAQLRVVYFTSSRQERWTGPGSFRAGKGAGEMISGKAAEIVSLPAGVSQRIAHVPDLVKSAKLGGIQMRGGLKPRGEPSAETPTTVAEARGNYERMRKELPADDITSELYLYSVLDENRMYGDMKPVLDEMLRKQPGNDDVKQLKAWVDKQLAK